MCIRIVMMYPQMLYESAKIKRRKMLNAGAFPAALCCTSILKTYLDECAKEIRSTLGTNKTKQSEH